MQFDDPKSIFDLPQKHNNNHSIDAVLPPPLHPPDGGDSIERGIQSSDTLAPALFIMENSLFHDHLDHLKVVTWNLWTNRGRRVDPKFTGPIVERKDFGIPSFVLYGE